MGEDGCGGCGLDGEVGMTTEELRKRLQELRLCRGQAQSELAAAEKLMAMASEKAAQVEGAIGEIERWMQAERTVADPKPGKKQIPVPKLAPDLERSERAAGR